MDKKDNYFLLVAKTAAYLFFVTAVISSLNLHTLAQRNLIAEEYIKIKPFISTRDDVEKLFGESEPKEYAALYKNISYKNIGTTITVEYSRGACDSEFAVWNSPEWTVERISYTPFDEQLNLRAVILDLTKFRKRQVGDVLSHITYENNKSGITVIYDKLEKTVVDIIITPTSKQKKRFACVENMKWKP